MGAGQRRYGALWRSGRSRLRNDAPWPERHHAFGEYTGVARLTSALLSQINTFVDRMEMDPGAGETGDRVREVSTLPVLFSTHIAFFLASMQRAPASTVVIVDGGVCWSPGPSLRGKDGLGGSGRFSWVMVSPGKMNVETDGMMHR